jgi:hypothetical protein
MVLLSDATTLAAARLGGLHFLDPPPPPSEDEATRDAQIAAMLEEVDKLRATYGSLSELILRGLRAGRIEALLGTTGNALSPTFWQSPSAGEILAQSSWEGIPLLVEREAFERFLDEVEVDAGSAQQAEPDTSDRTGAPGRPSSMHLVEAEFDRRVSAGESWKSKLAVADDLAAWLRREHPRMPKLTSKTILNRLRHKIPSIRPGRPPCSRIGIGVADAPATGRAAASRLASDIADNGPR